MKTKYIAPIAAVLALTSGSAMAQDAGWYVRGELGASTSGEVDDASQIDLDDGWVVGAAGGYAFSNGIRAEGELLYLGNDIDSLSDGETSAVGVFANIAYEFNQQGRIRPFVGAGLGFAQVNFEDGVVDDDDIGFAYQAKAGVAYDINDRLTAEVAYRYIGVTDLEFGSGGPSPIDGDYENQAVTVGLRYKLGY